ncbi:MAG: NUDIX domain-containing protein [Leptospirales bacterium]
MSEDIRIRVAGLYVENGKLLLVKHHKFGKDYYLLPGGGQEKGETVTQALAREMQEELSVDIVSSGLLFSGESVPHKGIERRQVMQLVLRIDTIQGELKLVPDGPLVGHYWADFEELDQLTIYPLCISQIKDVLTGKTPESFVSYPWLD